MNRSTRIRLAAASAIALGIGAASVVPALADDGGGGSNSGHCSLHSTWELKGSPDNGRLQVEFRIETGHAGQVWDWQLLDNGTLAAQGQATSRRDSDGRVERQRRIPNMTGPDAIELQASNTATGETCVGHIVVRGRDH